LASRDSSTVKRVGETDRIAIFVEELLPARNSSKKRVGNSSESGKNLCLGLITTLAPTIEKYSDKPLIEHGVYLTTLAHDGI